MTISDLEKYANELSGVTNRVGETLEDMKPTLQAATEYQTIAKDLIEVMSQIQNPQSHSPPTIHAFYEQFRKISSRITDFLRKYKLPIELFGNRARSLIGSYEMRLLNEGKEWVEGKLHHIKELYKEVLESYGKSYNNFLGAKI